MKKIVCSMLFIFVMTTALFSITPSSLKPLGRVSDFAGIISPEDVQKMTALIGELKQKTGAEIAVVTIKSLEGEDLNDFTQNLFKEWKIGEKGKDNGVMLLVAFEVKKNTHRSGLWFGRTYS